jgi:hypothetical protein
MADAANKGKEVYNAAKKDKEPKKQGKPAPKAETGTKTPKE